MERVICCTADVAKATHEQRYLYKGCAGAGSEWSGSSGVQLMSFSGAPGAGPEICCTADVAKAAREQRYLYKGWPGAAAETLTGLRPGRDRRYRSHRSVMETPAPASSFRSVTTDSPTTACGSPTTFSMNAPPSESMVNEPATCSGSPVAT